MNRRWVVVLGVIALVACARKEEAATADHAGGAVGDVVFGTLTVKQGGVSSNDLTQKLSDLQPAMKGCYTNSLLQNSKAEGVIELHMKGEQSGTTVQVSKTTVDSSLTQCVTEALQGVKADSGRAFEADWSVNFALKGY